MKDTSYKVSQEGSGGFCNKCIHLEYSQCFAAKKISISAPSYNSKYFVVCPFPELRKEIEIIKCIPKNCEPCERGFHTREYYTTEHCLSCYVWEKMLNVLSTLSYEQGRNDQLKKDCDIISAAFEKDLEVPRKNVLLTKLRR